MNEMLHQAANDKKELRAEAHEKVKSKKKVHVKSSHVQTTVTTEVVPKAPAAKKSSAHEHAKTEAGKKMREDLVRKSSRRKA